MSFIKNRVPKSFLILCKIMINGKTKLFVAQLNPDT